MLVASPDDLACRRRDPPPPGIHYEPLFAPYPADPRLHALLAKMNLVYNVANALGRSPR
ncbi:hypothetical protein SBA3_3800031 [Candidatus Sulfopaludibacter sp. SbA3]|nr:hypothetical protein SBA3_3800031 [Candidatus Sulfopaludibacter sp. SbA3]